MTHPHEPILAAGLAWLFDTVQPDGALTQHHGFTAPEVDNRSYRFCPAGAAARTVVIVDVAHYEFHPSGYGATPVLTKDEMTALVAAVEGLGQPVASTWNGAGCITGSVGLAAGPHPSLAAAVARYHAGCPDHGGSVFCGGFHNPECTWGIEERRLLVRPEWPTLAPTGGPADGV
jgi:hypothetical protein